MLVFFAHLRKRGGFVQKSAIDKAERIMMFFFLGGGASFNNLLNDLKHGKTSFLFANQGNPSCPPPKLPPPRNKALLRVY